jgi:hypothetical protein
MDEGKDTVAEALERFALSLADSGAVPVPELVRALERAAERLRVRSMPTELPSDLVSQAEASRAVGVSRQAVNQWVRKGVVRSYVRGGGGHHGPRVSLGDVAVAANRHSGEMPFPAPLRRELLEFLSLVERGDLVSLARDARAGVEDSGSTAPGEEQKKVLGEFVVAAMAVGERREFSESGLELLANMPPRFVVDRASTVGSFLASMDLLVHSADGTAGFDSPVAVLLALLAVASVGARYTEPDTGPGWAVAAAAHEVWGDEWPARLYDAVFHVGESRPSHLTRYTASLAYLDHNRFLRRAQTEGVSIGYVRGPGPILPQRFYGAHVMRDILEGRSRGREVWWWAPSGRSRPRPDRLPSTDNPFRVFNYEYGLLDSTIRGIRRYCFSADDAGRELRFYHAALPARHRTAYLDCAVDTLARTLRQSHIELVSISRAEDFDWWKDHIIRASKREILLGLRDERARRTAHGLLVQTNMLPHVVESAGSDAALRDRLRIYVKNLEFDTVEARYRDDLGRGVSRIVKAGGLRLTEDEALTLAHSEIRDLLDRTKSAKEQA